jgi:UDPglucose--hexose-1-phosphate uridylyltransferase
MTEPVLRFDVTTGDWVVFATGRSSRPQPLGPASIRPVSDHDPQCAFCPGQEDKLATIVYTEAGDAEVPWSVRIVSNKYPALVPEASREHRNTGLLFREMGGHGVHEVVIESAHHARLLADQPHAQLVKILEVLQRRYRELSEDTSLEVVQIYKNHGARAGSSLVHPHFQILATPVFPRQTRLKYAMAAEYYHATGGSVYADLCKAELESGVRVIDSNADYVCFAPYASRVPYETWIVPLTSASTFGNANPASFPALANILRGVLRRLREVLGDQAYNLTINSAPRRHADEQDFVWHIEIIPRLGIAAGFEIATGMSINSVLPEQAARLLREATD